MSKPNSVDAASLHPIVHTPGPWKVANNSRSVLAGPIKINQQAGPAAQSAAVEARNEFTLRANAKLIAAAPDMLAAIQGALRIADLWRPSEDTPEDYWEEAKALYMMLSQFEEIARKVV